MAAWRREDGTGTIARCFGARKAMEMIYDFDNPPSHEGIYSSKFNTSPITGHPDDVIPMHVADMDFPTVPAVSEALSEYASRGYLGYSYPIKEYREVAAKWFHDRHGVDYKESWLVQTPGVVFALAQAMRAFTKPGDAVMIQPPVYYPFAMGVQANGRKLVENELVYTPGVDPAYTIDFDDFESKIVSENVKMFLLCSPHNPVSRVWTVEELQRMGQICKEHGVLMAVDEIHCDIVYNGNVHTPFLKACPDMADSTIICTAPSKSFSLAGLQCSNIWIPNKEMRDAYEAELTAGGTMGANVLGTVACMTAYKEGAEWLDQAVAYIEANTRWMQGFLEENLPQAKMVKPEGTYLIWVDFSALGMTVEELDKFMQEKAKLWLDAGSMFGGDGGQFQRFNLACSRSTLEKAMGQLKSAIEAL